MPQREEREERDLTVDFAHGREKQREKERDLERVYRTAFGVSRSVVG